MNNCNYVLCAKCATAYQVQQEEPQNKNVLKSDPVKRLIRAAQIKPNQSNKVEVSFKFDVNASSRGAIVAS